MHSNFVYSDISPLKKVGLWSQVALMFFIVSGGAYGLEAVIGEVGPFWSLMLVLVVPVFWAIPIALMVAELSSALPHSGGYYGWVKRALGPRWGFQQGWWALCYSAADAALYPVLFVTYLSFFFPALNDAHTDMVFLRWGICCVFILFSLLLNLRGTKVVGLGALINLFLVVIPFIVFLIIGIQKGNWQGFQSVFSPETDLKLTPAGFAAGLAIILWNYCGWDNASTYAAEVEDPQRSYPRALRICMFLILASYILPMIVGFSATTHPNDWSQTSGWPHIASMLGGSWLGTWVAVAALISTWSLFNSQLLYGSRLPMAMARDGWLPQRFYRLSTKTSTPNTVLVTIAAGATALSALSLTKLMVVDILFYFLSLALQFITLIVLRKKEPQLPRPFKIPLSITGLCFLAVAPLTMGALVGIFSLFGNEESLMQLTIVILGVLMGFGISLIKRSKVAL